MHAASREALAAAEHRLDGVLADPGANSSVVGEELYSFSRLLGAEISLRRALADASAEESTRKGLLRRLTEGKLSEPTLQVLDQVVTSRWSTPRELLAGVRTLGAIAMLSGAEQDGALETVEGELFGVARLLADAPELEQALSDQAAPVEAKRNLISGLLAGKIHATTQMLVEQAATATGGRGIGNALDALADLAAKRRQRSVGHVMTAVPLSAGQRDALAEKLNRIYGRDIALHVEVKPSVIGGLVVKVGDEVIDGSSAGRIMALRGQLN